MAQLLVPLPVLQFCDADGAPYAGGSLYTYTPGTSTPKNSYQDEAGTVLNTNPIILDAAGRAIIWGSGDYRLVLRDLNGVLIYDQVSSCPPAPTDISGLQSQITAEASRAQAAESTLTNNLNAEITRATGAENTLNTNLGNEINRAMAEETGLQNQINALGAPTAYSLRYGATTSASNGTFSAIFSPVFPHSCDSVVCTTVSEWWAGVDSVSASGFSGKTASPLVGSSWIGGPVAVFWLAVGH